jgi:hypothetical protein
MVGTDHAGEALDNVFGPPAPAWWAPTMQAPIFVGGFALKTFQKSRRLSKITKKVFLCFFKTFKKVGASLDFFYYFL